MPKVVKQTQMLDTQGAISENLHKHHKSEDKYQSKQFQNNKRQSGEGIPSTIVTVTLPNTSPMNFTSIYLSS